MKKLVFLLAALFFALKSLFAADPLVTQIRVLDASFNKLSVSAGIRVELVNGRQYLEVKTFERYQPILETFVDSEGTLVVRWERGKAPRMIRGGEVVVKIAVPNLRRVALSGGGRIELNGFRFSDDTRLSVSGGGRIVGDFRGDDMVMSVSGGGRIDSEKITADDITLSVSGGGRISASVRCSDMNLSVSGGGRLTLSGTCEDVAASIAGGGNIDARELVARNVMATTSGGGEGEFTATGSSRSSKSGGGSIIIRKAD